MLVVHMFDAGIGKVGVAREVEDMIVCIGKGMADVSMDNMVLDCGN
jgi:hypothetical protein